MRCKSIDWFLYERNTKLNELTILVASQRSKKAFLLLIYKCLKIKYFLNKSCFGLTYVWLSFSKKETFIIYSKEPLTYFWKATLKVLYVIILSRTSFRVNLQSIVCLNVKELLARRRRHIWSLSDSKEIQTHNHFIRKGTLNHLAKLAAKWLSVFYELSGCGFESHCCHLYFKGTIMQIRKSPYMFVFV